MSGVLYILAGAGAAFWYLQSLQPPAQVDRSGAFQGRTIEGGRDIDDHAHGEDYQPTVGYTPDIDPQTGLRFVWVHKANGTRSKSFTDAAGVQINRAHAVQA